MREVLDCLPCYLKQVKNTLNLVGIAEDKAKEVMRATLPVIQALDPHGTPAENSTHLLHKVYELLGNRDPFREAKKASNDLALKMLPQLRNSVNRSPDPLYSALKVAVAGNIIDMGIVEDIDVEKSVEEALSVPFARDDYPLFKRLLAELTGERRVMILGDNSGEIAFDRLLVEQLVSHGVEVTYVVKGGPILNDATVEDAEQVHMGDVARVITTGCDFLGVSFPHSSPAFLEELRSSPLIISKGQANYESLESTPYAGGKTFFLLRAKCDVIARSLRVNLGDMVFCRD